jgi:hypothetical protein
MSLYLEALLMREAKASSELYIGTTHYRRAILKTQHAYRTVSKLCTRGVKIYDRSSAVSTDTASIKSSGFWILRHCTIIY